MKKRTILFLATMVWLTWPVHVMAIDVKISTVWGGANDPSMQVTEPGTAPKGAFPLVCYIVGVRPDAVRGGSAAIEKNYPDGVTMPDYAGYLVFDENYVVTSHWRYPDPYADDDFVEFNGYGKNDRLSLYGGMPRSPRWSWNGVRWIIRSLAFDGKYVSIAYTMGVPPDPEWIPKVHKEVHVTVEQLKDRESRANLDMDPTIINLKPGMRFRLITLDMELERIFYPAAGN